MKKTYKLLLATPFLMTMLFFASCEKDSPDIPNEEELITTLTYTLTPAGGGAPIVFSFQDLDGDGGNTPIITTGTLAANTTYTGVLELLNEAESPAESISEEVEEEAEEHQFFFAASSALNATVAYGDVDGNGKPLGLQTTVVTGDVSTGTLTITLRHEPDKSAAGVSGGDLTNAGGETDIEVTFDVTVQ
jgi:hypothetical protein